MNLIQNSCTFNMFWVSITGFVVLLIIELHKNAIIEIILWRRYLKFFTPGIEANFPIS